MVYLGRAVLDAMFVADPVEDMAEGRVVAASVGELHSVVRENLVNGVWYRFDQVPEELGRGHFAGLLNELDEGEFAGAINGNEEVQLAFPGPQLGDVPSRACRHALPGSGCGSSRAGRP